MESTTRHRLAIHVFVLFAWLCAVSTPGVAWDATGHRIVAQIAWDQLSSESRTEAAALTQRFDVDFIDASVWLDEVRGAGVHLFSRWHYINHAAKGSTRRARTAHADNLLWAVAESRKSLASDAPDAARGLALVSLIHLVGDAHQPLHLVARFDDDHPRGDRGGNDIALPEPWGNLHRLWDRMGGLVQPPDQSRARVDRDAIRRWARRLVKDHPASATAHDLDPNAWAAEGRLLAGERVYPGVRTGHMPKDDYLAGVQAVAAERLVAAGMRLAAVIEDALARR